MGSTVVGLELLGLSAANKKKAAAAAAARARARAWCMAGPNMYSGSYKCSNVGIVCGYSTAGGTFCMSH